MTFTLTDLDYLGSDSGTQLLTKLADADLSDSQVLALLTRLRKHYSPAQARAGLEMAQLRRKAVTKFGDDAGRMFFTADGLEQASDPLVRSYRAAGVGDKRVVDVCCGIGTDSLAMARAGAWVVGLDIDPVRVRIAQMNAASLGVQAQFEIADVREGIPEADVIFYDPARRDTNGRRIFHVEQYHPPLSLVKSWWVEHKATQIVAKLSPGVDLAQLADYPGGVEFISVKGDLKEAVLWTDADFGLPRTKATLLTDTGVFSWVRDATLPDAAIGEPRRWLVEPDAAMIRAGLVQDLALERNGSLLDATIAYFTTDTFPEMVWGRAWSVLDWLPYNLKKLRACLRERNIGHVTVKKRGFPMTPDEIIPRLKLKGDEACVLVFTRHIGMPIVIICNETAPL